MGRRSGVETRLRKKAFSRYGERCAKCGTRKRLEIHHIKPVVRGGTDDIENLIPLCRKCHKFAPDDYIDFLRFLSSPYTPGISAMHHISLAMCEYFHTLVTDESQKYRLDEFIELGAKKYHEKNVEPLYDAMNRILWGFDN